MNILPKLFVLGIGFYAAVVFAAAGDEDFAKGKLAYQQKNYAEAFHHFSTAAEADHGEAELWLGSMYQSEDFGLQADWDKMYEWYERAAEDGNAEAAYRVASRNIGFMIWPDDDYSETIPLLERAAGLGHAEAMMQLTYIYAPNQEHHASKEKEVYWTQRGAEAGHPAAQFELSQMYFKGYGVEQDVAKAAKWLQAAAESGNPNAQYEFGVTLFQGLLGQEANRELGLEWIKLAARNETPAAFVFLGIAYLMGDGVEKDADVAYSLLVEAARLGDNNAPFTLAEVFVGGGFGDQDIETALTWVHIAELKGLDNADAARNILQREFGYEPYLLQVAAGRADDCVRSDYESRKCRTGIPSEAEKQAMKELYDIVSGND